MSFYQSGSFQHGTAITPHSDVDYIARIYFEDKPLSSTMILNNMRKRLQTLRPDLGHLLDRHPGDLRCQTTVGLVFADALPRYAHEPSVPSWSGRPIEDLGGPTCWRLITPADGF